MKELDVNAFELQKESSEYNKENDASKEVHFKLAGRCLLGLPKIQQTINNKNDVKQLKRKKESIEEKVKKGMHQIQGKNFIPESAANKSRAERERERVKRRMDENKNQRTRNDIERKILKNAYHIFN